MGGTMFGTNWRRLLAALALLCAMFACADQAPLPDASKPEHQASTIIGTLPWSGGDLCAGTPTGPLACGMTGRTGGASTGQIRLASGDLIMARNAGNTADMNIINTGGNDILIGDTSQVTASGLESTSLTELVTGPSTVALLGGGGIEWFTLADTPALLQNQSGTGANNGNTFLIQAQAGQNQTGSNANNNGGNLNLVAGQAGTGGSGAAGTQGTVNLVSGPVAGECVLSVSGTFNTPSQNGINLFQCPTVSWSNAGDAPVLKEGQQANGSNPNNFTISPQAPGAGAASTATGTPGSLVVNVAVPVSTGTEAGLSFRRNTVVKGIIQACPSGVGLGAVGCLFLGNSITPSATNYAMGSDGSTLAVNGPSELALGAGGLFSGGSVMEDIGTTGVQLASRTQSFGGGTGVVGIANATGAPSSNPSGGGIVYENSGILTHRGSGGTITEVAAPGSGTQNTQTATIQRRMGFLRTTATTAATIFTVGALGASHVETIDAVINSIDTTALASSAGSRIACSFVNSAGTLTQLGVTTTYYNHNYTSTPICTISGTTVLIQVSPKTTDTTDSQADVYVSVN